MIKSSLLWRLISVGPSSTVVLALLGLATHAVRPEQPSIVITDSEDKQQPPSIKDVMKKAHKGENCLISLVHFDVHQVKPHYETDEKNVAEMVRLVGLLTKQKPPRGSQESWEKLVQDYVDKGKTVQEKLKAKNLRESRAALDKFMTTCKGCHNAHKPN